MADLRHEAVLPSKCGARFEEADPIPIRPADQNNSEHSDSWLNIYRLTAGYDVTSFLAVNKPYHTLFLKKRENRSVAVVLPLEFAFVKR